MEFKNFNIDLSKAFSDQKAMEKGEGSAVIAELNVIDLDGDVTLPGAFGEQHVNVLPAHDFHSPRLGKGVLKEDGDFAISEFKFNLDEDAKTSKEWYSSLKFDMENGQPLQEWSYGFEIVDSEFGEFQGKQVRFLKSLKVHEISPVIRGAGIGTQTLSLKNKKNMTFAQELDLAIESLIDIKAFIDRAIELTEVRLKKNKTPMDGDKKKALQPFFTLLTEVDSDCKSLIVAIQEEAEDVKAVHDTFAQCHVTLMKAKQLSGV